MSTLRAKDLSLHYRVLPQKDVPKAFEIESAEYPESEAATLENLVYRQAAAPLLFLGCYTLATGEQRAHAGQQNEQQLEGDSLVGYIVSTQARGMHLTHESMSSHDPQGSSVCIHSVCVARAFQRQGIARTMMTEYLKHLQSVNKANACTAASSSREAASFTCLERVLLIAHKELIGLYAGVGFELVGQSEVEHGPDPWYEMVYNL
ncbi:hypothetical protein EDD11_003144 [Mortierella claussenii]|nr:hypothetical protein EDD11_003144 [Mortierella claussenii]